MPGVTAPCWRSDWQQRMGSRSSISEGQAVAVPLPVSRPLFVSPRSSVGLETG